MSDSPTNDSLTNDSPTHLKDWELDAVLYIERVHSSTGLVPSDDDIVEYLTTTKNHEPEVVNLARLKANRLFKQSMESRGIVVNYDRYSQLNNVYDLTPRQMAAASVMMNLVDRRSNEKKLRDLGISTEEWTNWTQDAKFAEYLRERSEVLIANSVHEAHVGLLRGVQQGNTASIKLYYELTGRYNPQEEQTVNIRLVIGRVLEAIQKHVRDPEKLNALAVEMSQIAIEAGTPNNLGGIPPVAKNSIVPSSSTRKEII